MLDFSRLSGKQLYLGPSVPEIDRRGNGCTLLKEESTVKTVVNPKDLLLEDLPKSEYSSTNCELAVYRRECDNAIIIFVANTSEKVQRSVDRFPGKTKIYRYAKPC